MKLRWLGITLALILLSGCSLVEEVNNSLDYTEQATSFINEASQFAGSIPDLAQEAVSNSNAMEKLTEQLDNMKARISEFNGLEAPAFAKDIHEQLAGYNETLSQQIDDYKEQIQNGVTDFKNTEMSQTLDKIQETMDQIRSLAP
ncbi:hypothetical protein SAMN05661091_5523 [Paenibacillus uliginis N3/975]|uniref:Lipoprotein n=1 Tax=Paenibacillus uliginis N3/975 TaxID=1313296 RepID=A0A1X7HRH6_9BACL|nr:DUF6376 family protein [Paenibacillus uliginis]SMF91646.1 hypothetical protein SAMN05661091_5523 [Paenibacillus uliginis N3/975]